jgi:hypothetical protein
MAENYQSPQSGTSPSVPEGQTNQGYQPDMAQRASSAFSDLKDKATEDLQQVRDLAEDQAQRAMDKGVEIASEQKNFVARQLSGIATALEKVGGELERGDQSAVGQYARELGSSAKKFATDIKDRDLGEIATMAEDFGRRQPAAFLGIAALAGFAASRFVTASARRHPKNMASMNQPLGVSSAGQQPASTASSTASTPTGVSTSYSEGRYNA